MTIENALQLEGCASRSGLFLAKFTLHMLTNCYLPASNQTFGIAIRFGDPDFLKGSNNLAIRRRNLDTSLNVCSTSGVT